MSVEWGEAMNALMHAGKIHQVEYGETERGFGLTLFFEKDGEPAGCVNIEARGKRDPDKPFERGAELRAGYNPDGVAEPIPE